MSETPVQDAQSADAFDEQLAAMLAQSRKAFENYSRTLTDIERQMIGTFYGYPAKLEGWVFYRVGLKTGPTSQVAAAMRHLLLQQGWVDAPKGTRMSGTEFYDGEDGAWIVCAPQETYRRQKAVEEKAQDKAAMRAEARKLDGLASTLAGLPGVSLDRFETSAVETSAEDAQARATEARLRRPARRG